MIPRDWFYDELTVLGADDVRVLRSFPVHKPRGRLLRHLTYGVVNLPGGFSAGVFAGRDVRRWYVGRGRHGIPGHFVVDAHDFYIVEIVPALPVGIAEWVNEQPYDGSHAALSGKRERLGSVARMFGKRGGIERRTLSLMDKSSVNLWFVDTFAALFAFLRAVRETLAQAKTQASDASRIQTADRRAWCLARLSAPGALGNQGAAERMLRAILHNDERVDARDPAVVRLREKYPPLPPGTP